MGGAVSGITNTIGSGASSMFGGVGGYLGQGLANIGGAVPKAMGIDTGSSPTNVTIQQGTNTGQTGQAYTGAQNSLASQQALLNALQGQNGLGAQSQTLGAQQGLLNQQGGLNSVGSQANALMAQQHLNDSLNLANGARNQSQALSAQQALAGQQQGVANQYQGVVNGTGPNPAMAALNQATGQNVANQSALMAGQRGASSNVGLLARQAAQQGASTQQQAVGQVATMQANQSLNALSGLSGQQQAIGNTEQNVANIAGQQVGAQETGIGAQQQAASNLVGQQQAQQQAVAGQANTLAGQQVAGVNQNTSAQQSEQQILQNALANQNQQNVAMQTNTNTANAALKNTSLQGQQAITGGLMNSLGSGAGSLLGGSAGGGAGAGAGAAAAAMAQGGQVRKPKKMAFGYDTSNDQADQTTPNATSVTTPYAAIPSPQTIGSSQATQGPQSSLGQILKNGFAKGLQSDPFNMASNQNYGAQALQKGFGSFGPAIGSLLSGKNSSSSLYGGTDSNTTPSNAPSIPDSGIEEGMAAKGGMAKKHDYRGGGNVKAHTPAQKAVKAGNSYSNDKIPAVLSEGEVVIPRSIMQGKDPARGAADFVAKVLAKRGRKSA